MKNVTWDTDRITTTAHGIATLVEGEEVTFLLDTKGNEYTVQFENIDASFSHEFGIQKDTEDFYTLYNSQGEALADGTAQQVAEEAEALNLYYDPEH